MGVAISPAAIFLSTISLLARKSMYKESGIGSVLGAFGVFPPSFLSLDPLIVLDITFRTGNASLSAREEICSKFRAQHSLFLRPNVNIIARPISSPSSSGFSCTFE